MTDLTTLIDHIRNAIADDADADTRKRGADACRAILTALSATPGRPLTDPPPPASPLAAAAQQLGSAPPSLVLDALIGKLRALLPEGAEARPPAGSPQLRIPFIQMPANRKPQP